MGAFLNERHSEARNVIYGGGVSEEELVAGEDVGDDEGSEELVDHEALLFEASETTVGFLPEHGFHMTMASKVMCAAASSEAAAAHAVLQCAAMYAAHLMARDGLIQTYGLACVHEDCVANYKCLNRRLEFLGKSSDLQSVYEAVHAVLVLAADTALPEQHHQLIRAHIQAIHALVQVPSTYDYSYSDHKCVALYQVVEGHVE